MALALDRGDRRHTEGTRGTLTAMLTSMDGLVERPGVLVIASSNTDADSLDGALTRAGRIGHKIAFSLPDEEERLDLLKLFGGIRRDDAPEPELTRSYDGVIDWARLSRMTRGWSPADLSQLFDDALGVALAEDRYAINQTDLEEAAARGGHVVPDKDVSAAVWTRAAIHEAGHVAAVSALRGREQVYSVRLEKGGGGLTSFDLDDRRVEDMNITERLDQLVICYAGTAAERMLLDTFSSGSTSDHRNATAIMLSLVTAGSRSAFT